MNLIIGIRKYILIGGAVIGMALAAFFFAQYYSSPGPLTSKKIVFIEKGMGLSAIAEHLRQTGVIEHPLFFEAHLRLRQVSHHLRAGEFEFEPHQSPEQVFDVISKGPFVQHAITIPEGLRSSEIVALLKDAPLLTKDLNALPLKEGTLLPETYYYTWNEHASAVQARMEHAMQSTLAKAWNDHKAESFLKTPEEVLILASIVEKETGKASERPQVAAVFLNRLRAGMRLQSDPTVMYGLEVEHGKPHNDLSKADLQTPSAYNTYMNAGLPPSPICNPGKASIEAVMKPADTQDLYFVADGTGGHVFAKTYEEHARNHQKWRVIRDRKE